MGKKSKGRIEKFNKNSQIVDFKKVQKEKDKEEKAAKKERKKSRKEERAAAAPVSEAEKKHRSRVDRQKNRRRLIAAAVAVILLLIVGFSVYNIVDLKMEQNALLSKQEKLEKQKKNLESELGTVNDPEYIEQQARKQLKLIKPGETLYVLKDDQAKKDSSDDN
ncbi:MAG: septum formation initiator family protein [Eubacteriaceae bacterium]|nr:septum formation initiator family protein [Eubacteriaceae bacterium]